MSLSDALKQTRANRAARRQSVIDAMAPIKRALLEYKRNISIREPGVKPHEKHLGEYVNCIEFDVASGVVTVRVNSIVPKTITISCGDNRVARTSLESALLHVAELMTP